MGLGAYMRLRTADRSEKPAEMVTAGDLPREAVSGDAVSVRTVLNGPGVGMYRVVTHGGAVLDLTEDHTVLTNEGPLPAGDVRPGLPLLTPGGTDACAEAGPLAGDYMVYDIVLEGGGFLVANGIFVGT